MSDKHLSSQFDSELHSVSTRVMELGGLVESQLLNAIYALTHFSDETADRVIQTEDRVDSMEVEIDHDLSSIIARRQPTARDLRLLIAISKTTANLERVDDDSEEDLLALSRDFSLHELIEDELLMALPVVPRHEVCPSEVPMSSSDEDFEAANAERPNPFAALAGIRIDKDKK